MSAIPAASVNMRTLADGTLRVSFDIEPNQAQDAFRLFAAPGTPVAIAALKSGYAAVAEPDPPKEPVGPLCKWLVMRCGEPEFWEWLGHEWTGGVVDSVGHAGIEVKLMLGIDSRKQIDTDPAVEAKFHELIRLPYQKWLVRRQG